MTDKPDAISRGATARRLGPDFRWPGGRRVAVVFNVAFEGWSDGKPPGIGPMGNVPHRRAVKAFFGKAFQRHLQQRLASGSGFTTGQTVGAGKHETTFLSHHPYSAAMRRCIGRPPP